MYICKRKIKTRSEFSVSVADIKGNLFLSLNSEEVDSSVNGNTPSLTEN
jgi:hypothetical protein